jgi:Aldo/keto reductase family
MDYATLGNTGLLVSKLCFGTMTFGDGRGLFKAISTVGQAAADELVKTSIEGAINFFDTADNYTEGESEKILGQSLKNLNIARKDVVIATKVYSRVGPGRNDIGASRGHIMDGVEASLRRLQTDHIDLYQIHGNDPVTHAGQRPAPRVYSLTRCVKSDQSEDGTARWRSSCGPGGLQLGLYAQQVAKLSPKVKAVVNAPPVDLKDDDTPLLRLKKERFNAALNEAKARFDPYNRGLTRIPELIAVGERLFGAEVDLYDKPEEKAQVLQRQ